MWLISQYDIMLLTETWFTKHTESFFNYSGFNRFATNRSDKRIGGGVAIYTKNTFNAKIAATHTSTTMSSLWVLVRIPDIKDQLLFGVIYHPPGLSKHQQIETIDHIHDTIQLLSSRYKNAGIVLYGDFNNLDTTSIEPVLGLSQIVHFPTRKEAFLDKLLTNVPEYIRAGCAAAPPVGSSDHMSVEVLSAFKKPVLYETITKRIVTPAAKVKISLELNKQNWMEVFQ